MKKLLAAFALLAGLASPALAQQTTPSTIAGALAAGQNTPPADKPSQDQIDAAMELIHATNAAANMAAILDVIEPAEAAQFKREHPDASDETAAKLLAIVHQAIMAHTDQMLQIAAISYARHFSIDELHALTKFYQSDIGQKYIGELPAIVKENGPVEIAFLRNAITQEVLKAIETLKSQGVKI